ncbi:Pol protein [Phytophthora palmivora]|uniref:Pol protein n=1 Tax=Phytophthora palmivora TaxID=4796 RepID=A0A2P4WZY8_9STRA|nr:Pol protein [Phytophthora palmivora]
MDRGESPHLTDAQFESVRKMVGIFGGDALRSLAAATPAEQVERIEAFDTYKRGLIAHVQGSQAPWVTVFMNGLKVGPSCKELFRVHASMVEVSIQIALQEEYSHRQARTLRRCGKATVRRQAQCRELQQQESAQGRYPWNWFPSKPRGSRGPWQKPRPKIQGNWGHQKGRPTGEGLSSHAKAGGQVSVRLADGTVVNVPAVRMNLAVKFEDIHSAASFLVLDMDKYDLILGILWLEKHKFHTGQEDQYEVGGIVEPPVWITKYHTRSLRPTCTAGRQVKESAVRLEAQPEVSALLNLEELSIKDFPIELKSGEIATLIPRKDVLLNNMSGCKLYGALVDGYYQILMRESDIPLIATIAYVHTQTYVDDIFVHSSADGGQTATEVHLKHLHRAFEVMGTNKPYANIDKCVFAAEEIKVHCSVVSGVGKDDEGRERVISFQSSQLKAAERNYSVHDKELLAMKYALVKLRVHLLGPRPFVIYTDRVSLQTATNSPHLSQRMTRWLSFFAECNFCVEYKSGNLNVLVDALSRRREYELAHVSRVTTDLYDRIRIAYRGDENYTSLVQFLPEGKDTKVDRLPPRQRAQLRRYELADGLLHYRVDPGDPLRVVVPNDEELKFDILLDAHDAQISDHLDQEKTYQTASQTFWWHRMYKWVAHYVKTCEICQRVKSSGHASAPLESLPVPADCWKSMSLNFDFGLPANDKGNTGILVFVCRLSKMVHLAPVRDKVTGKQAAQLFLDSVFRYHGLPETIVLDRDPRFTGAFWDTLFQLLGTKLTMSTADHPQTDGQTERVNRVLEDTLRSFCAEAPRSWSDQLPMVGFGLNNAVHASTGFTPFYLNGLRHPRCR